MVTLIILDGFGLRKEKFGNAILSMLLTFLGDKLNVDIYLAAIVVFVNRMFLNLTIIRKYYIEKIWTKTKEVKKVD